MEIDAFKLEDWCNKYEGKAKYDLLGTCIDCFSINELLNISNVQNIDEIMSKSLGYGKIHGSERLRNAINSLYNKNDDMDIAITHGAVGANQLIYLSLLEEGDEVISIVPSYQQHYSIPKSLGVDVKYYFLKPENNWLPDIEELKLLFTDKTKMLILTNPNNPTGSVILDSLMKEIIKISNGAYILCDEVYKDIVVDKKYNTTSISDLYKKGIAVGSMSKAFSLAGLRVGWIRTRKNVIEKINHHREYNTISISLLDDYFSSIAIENKDRIFERNIKKMKQGLEILKNWAKCKSLIELVIPNGGTTAFIKYNKEISSYELCERLFEDTGVLFLPGETLEMNNYLRLGYCGNLEKLSEALDIFYNWLEQI